MTITADQRRLQQSREQQSRESDIATCECGRQVRLHPDKGWIHSGPCTTPIKREHKEVPVMHRFPDGSRVSYWRDADDGLVYGQLFSKGGKRIRRKFTYLGDTP